MLIFGFSKLGMILEVQMLSDNSVNPGCLWGSLENIGSDRECFIKNASLNLVKLFLNNVWFSERSWLICQIWFHAELDFFVPTITFSGILCFTLNLLNIFPPQFPPSVERLELTFQHCMFLNDYLIRTKSNDQLKYQNEGSKNQRFSEYT